MKIALAQINPIIGDFEYNFNKITSVAQEASKLGSQMVVLPELAICGYPPRDLLEKPDFIAANLACLERLIESIHGIAVICGFVDRSPTDRGNLLLNAAALFENGRLIGKVNKRLLPTYDIFDERRYFEPGTECQPIDFGRHRIGLTICEDVWNDEDFFKRHVYDLDPVADLVKNGANLIINISASPFHVGKISFRHRMLANIARKYALPLLFVNQVGGNDSVVFDGSSTGFNDAGQAGATAYDFQEDLIVFDTVTGNGDMHTVTSSELETLRKALVLGTRDYALKCGFSKAVVGLSGGIDSALTVAIAVQALGAANVLGVFMPSQYTSQDNYVDTQQLARNLGIELIHVPIDEIFDAFLHHLAPDFGAGVPDITEQNIQARIRGTILMGFSNRHGSLLLTTGNKSELAVGYCTLYGDMSGGLAVISDVPKTTVYELARHQNRDKDLIPQRILRKVPSAELKPNQTDQDDLPPYDLLDGILKGYIEEFKSVQELVQMGYPRNLVQEVLMRVDRNEYKRHQSPPGLKVTSKAFGYGRRYPIAQGYHPL